MEGNSNIRIRIKTMDMKSHVLQVQESMPVDSLKELIFKEVGARIDMQGKVLRGCNPLSAYGVENNSCLHLVVTAFSPNRNRMRRNVENELLQNQEPGLSFNDEEVEFEDNYHSTDAWSEVANMESMIDREGNTEESFLSDASTILEIEIFSSVEDPELSKSPIQMFCLIFLMNLVMLTGIHGLAFLSIGKVLLVVSSFVVYMLMRSVTQVQVEGNDIFQGREGILEESEELDAMD